MSGFQIPGLGQAKPNETLPPLPTDGDVAATAASNGDHEMTEAAAAAPTEHANAEAQNSQAENISNSSKEQTTDSANGVPQSVDSMVVDRPQSPPSLTSALEAAIGGLDQSTTATANQAAAVSEATAQPQQDQVQEQPAPLQNDQSEHPEWEIDSSPYESSSESSSSDSSDDDDSDNEGYELLGVEETARMLMEAEGGSDDEGERGGKSGGTGTVRTKNELPDEVIPKPDVTITSEMKIEELGVIENMVANIILIKANTTGEYQVLDNGSVLCDANRVVIGAVAETIGKVLQPMYTVYFTSEDELKQLGLEVGSKIFYPVDHASYVFTEPLKNIKGSDASNLHDEEVGDEEMEFSDDEKEAEHKRAVKQKKKDRWKKDDPSGSRGAGGREPHPLRQELQPGGGLNYDDEDYDDGPYKPLQRPPGYGTGPTTNEPVELPPRSSNYQRGGRRGDFRGRGGRGRGGGGRGGRGGHGGPRDGYSLPPQQSSPSSGNTWNNPSVGSPAANQNGSPAPAMPNFPFQIPGWPQPPAPPGQSSHLPPPPPPPPPGWPGAQAQAQGQPSQANGNNAFLNPAFLAALMGQMQQQQAQNGQSQWGGGQGQPPQGGRGQ